MEGGGRSVQAAMGWRAGAPSWEITVSPPFSRRPGSPSRPVHQLLRMFFRQQDEIRRLKEELAQKDIRIRQLQLELKNLRNSPKNC